MRPTSAARTARTARMARRPCRCRHRLPCRQRERPQYKGRRRGGFSETLAVLQAVERGELTIDEAMARLSDLEGESEQAPAK